MAKNSEQTTLSVKDFGPIAEATVELRPLTVFVGASNTGKSYMAILLYALHQFFGVRGASRRSGPPALYQYLSHLAQEDNPLERERFNSVREWLRTLELPDEQSRIDIALPDTIAALVRSVLADVESFAMAFDAEVRRCFGVAATQSLIRHSGSKFARVALRRGVPLDSGHDSSVGYDFTVTRSHQGSVHPSRTTYRCGFKPTANPCGGGSSRPSRREPTRRCGFPDL